MVQIPYTPIENTNFRLPYLPFQLVSNQDTLNVMGLVDSSAAMNILSYDLGTMLGLVWEQQTQTVTLTGLYAGMDARLVTIDTVVSSVSEARIQQRFAWVRGTEVPVTLGQDNFFMLFMVTFNGAQGTFDISSATA